MKAKSPKELAQMLIDSGRATSETIKGCSEEEIRTIEAQFNVRLPDRYKEYLRVMGKEAGDFASDLIMTYPGIIKFCRPSGERWAAEKGFALSATHFVFLIRDDMFMFFDASLEDPPVYRLDTAVDEKPIVVADSFLELLALLVNEAVETQERLRKMGAL